jgi:hypothetical protein
MNQHPRRHLPTISRAFSARSAGPAAILGVAALAVTGLAAPASAALLPAGVAASSPASAGSASPAPGDPGSGLLIYRWGDRELVPVPGSSGTTVPVV